MPLPLPGNAVGTDYVFQEGPADLEKHDPIRDVKLSELFGDHDELILIHFMFDPSWQAYVTMVDETSAPMPRNDIMEALQQMGISTRPGTHAVHMLGYYRDLMGCKPEDFPGARRCNDQSMAIPLHNRMVDEDYRYVVDALKSIG